jgi:hypothetical protein
MKTNSDNCTICSIEFPTTELRALVPASNLKTCQSCLVQSNPADDYAEVKNIIFGYLKFAQQITDTELASPDIKIEPMESNIHKAVELLKKVNPSYFVGVRKIVVDTGSAFGYVQSGAGNDPAVIHLNLPKIRAEIQSKIGNLPKEEQEKELVRQLALTISHERGHISGFKPETGFAPESAAENEANSMTQKIDNYHKALT